MSIDFNSSENQSNFDLIPNNTLAKVRVSIKPGGFDDLNQGWSGGYATKNDSTGSVYLSCEFVILEGEYARRKVWGIIGLHSNKGPEWGNMGRSFIKAILNSARGFCESDNSPAAQSARKINGIGDLDGMEFVAKITTKKDQNEELRNEIRFAITPDHKDYKTTMGAVSTPSTVNTQSNPNIPAVNNRPAWAK